MAQNSCRSFGSDLALRFSRRRFDFPSIPCTSRGELAVRIRRLRSSILMLGSSRGMTTRNPLFYPPSSLMVSRTVDEARGHVAGRASMVTHNRMFPGPPQFKSGCMKKVHFLALWAVPLASLSFT